MILSAEAQTNSNYVGGRGGKTQVFNIHLLKKKFVVLIYNLYINYNKMYLIKIENIYYIVRQQYEGGQLGSLRFAPLSPMLC